jgi:IS5 family transposase
VNDIKVAQVCLDAMPPAATVIADKGYDSKALRDWLQARGTQAVIRPAVGSGFANPVSN